MKPPPTNGIYEVVANQQFKISLSNFSTVERKLPKKMATRHGRRSPVMSLAAPSNKAGGICESLAQIANRATAASIRRPPLNLTHLRNAASDEEIPNVLPTNQELHLSRLSRPNTALLQGRRTHSSGTLSTAPHCCKNDNRQ